MRTAALAAAMLLCTVAACSRQEPTPAPEATRPVAAPPTVQLTEPPLDRRQLLSALAEAASAAATGTEDADQQRRLDGKPFALRIRFGCAGEGSVGETRGWNFDEGKRVLRIRVSPDIADPAEDLRAFAGEGFESAEGFWLRQPWLLTAACPKLSQAPAEGGPRTGDSPKAAGVPASPRFGIVQFHVPGEARTHRRDGRSFEVTKPLGSDETPSGEGYDLVLSGRLQRLAAGRVIACRVVRLDAPPACVASVRFDHVSIEDPRDNTVIAEWSGA